MNHKPCLRAVKIHTTNQITNSNLKLRTSETYSQRRTRSDPCACFSCVQPKLRHQRQLCGIQGMAWPWRPLSLAPRVAAKHQGAAEAPTPAAVMWALIIHQEKYKTQKITSNGNFENKSGRNGIFYYFKPKIEL